MSAGRKTLLAKLAPQFSAQTENVAVEALGHILTGSSAARSALSDVLNSGGTEVGQIVRVRTQVTGGQGERPDLVGFDERGEERLLIEAKFWAGLTDSQPVAYLERLAGTGQPDPDHRIRPSALLFVAPAARLESLWDELLRRVWSSGLAPNRSHDDADGLRSAIVSRNLHLLLTDWPSLLNRMATSAAHAADSHTEADLRQLRGLCEREDGEAFLPLRSEELGHEFPRRMLGLRRLVDDATSRGVREGFINTKRLQVTPRDWGYGRYVRIVHARPQLEPWFGIHLYSWARARATPLWLRFSGEHHALEALPELWAGKHIPIDLPIGKEYEAVLDAVVARLKQIAAVIASHSDESR